MASLEYLADLKASRAALKVERARLERWNTDRRGYPSNFETALTALDSATAAIDSELSEREVSKE